MEAGIATNDKVRHLRERPVGEVVGQLARDVSLLVRQEIALAKAELREKAQAGLVGLGLFGAAGVVALCAAGALTAFLVLVFALFLAPWLAALVVGLALAATAALLALAGREQVEQAGPPIPEETIENVKEDAQWQPSPSWPVRMVLRNPCGRSAGPPGRPRSAAPRCGSCPPRSRRPG